MRRLKKKTKSYFKEKFLPALCEGTATTVKSTVAFVRDIVLQNAKIVLVLLALLWFWDNKVDKGYLKDFLAKPGNVLQEDQLARADVDCRDDSLVIQREGEEPERKVGIKKATFIQNKDGSYEADYKNRGFGLEPGVVITAGDGLRLGVDVEYAYWKRFGLVGGVTFPVQGRKLDLMRGHIGLSYDLPSRWLSHTSFYGGIDTNKTPTIGIRTKIGGGY